MLNSRDNFLAAIRFQSPEYVPLGNESIYHAFQFEGNFRMADWTDHWGVRWEVGLENTVPFPKGNPLPNLDHLEDYPIPDPNALIFTAEIQDALALVDRSTR